MQKKTIANKSILKESIQWLMLHYKLIIVVGLSYLGMDKIIEDLPFYDPSAVNMIHTLQAFSIQVFVMDIIEHMLLIFLIYIIVTAIMMTLNQRPLTVNAISIALNRKRKELFRITFVVALIISLMSMVLSSLILWLDAAYWMSEFFIVFASATFAIFFIFSPHEMLFKNKKTIDSILASFKIGKRYYFQLILLIFCVGFIHSFFGMLLDYLLTSTNYFFLVFTALNKFGLIMVITGMVTIFYYKISNENE